jgi:hypothetical protein
MTKTAKTPRAPRASKTAAPEAVIVKMPSAEQIEREAAEAQAEEAANLAAEAAAMAEEAANPTKQKYFGPMLALREAAKRGAYKKAINGQPSCGDTLAILLGTITPALVIRACIIALNLPGNPYLHLNIGQQSMNLRNKLRGALMRGEFGFGVVREAVEDVQTTITTAHPEIEVMPA